MSDRSDDRGDFANYGAQFQVSFGKWLELGDRDKFSQGQRTSKRSTSHSGDDELVEIGNWHSESESVNLSRVPLFATPCTVAHQAPLSMGFSRQEY